MLKTSHKQIVILFGFSYLLREYLTYATLILVILGGVLPILKLSPSKSLRTVATLVVFASYWFTYGKVIDPEVGLNFLTTVIVLKLLEKESDRDSYMIFFGMILLLSAGTLFEKSLVYVFFFTFSFFILIQDLYSLLKIRFEIKDLGWTLIWVLPMTAIFFILMPRVMNPMAFKNGTPSKGEVGYTPEVNVSQIESLSSNDSPVFQASVSKFIPQEQLYWRGNTLAFTDGWNWPSMPSDKGHAPFKLEGSLNQGLAGPRQNIHLYNREEYFFTLDHGTKVILENGYYDLGRSHTLAQHPWKTKRKYEVVSNITSTIKEDDLSDRSLFLNPSLSSAERKFTHEKFHGQSLSELTEEIESHFKKEGFSYSLSPGRIQSLNEFLLQKKTGFCSHYASALAVILRVKGVPTRLVSGFLGGRYNRFAGSYLITQNDAHVWVEAYQNGEWLRIDPTAWIAPERIMLGGEAFNAKEASKDSVLGSFAFFRFSAVQDFQQWFGQWDMKFYAAIEDIDYQGQDAMFERLKFKKEWFYILAPILLGLFVLIYTYYLIQFTGDKKSDPLREAWLLLNKKARKRGLSLSFSSISDSEQAIKLSDHPEIGKLRILFERLVQVSFKSRDIEEMKRIKKEISRL